MAVNNIVVGFITTYAISAYHHSPLMLWVWIPLRWGILDTTLCDKVCQWLATDQWFSSGTPVSSTNKSYLHNITKELLKVQLNTITLTYNVFDVKLPDNFQNQETVVWYLTIPLLDIWQYHSLISDNTTPWYWQYHSLISDNTTPWYLTIPLLDTDSTTPWYLTIPLLDIWEKNVRISDKKKWIFMFVNIYFINPGK
jgi:hypothetical protein